MINNNIPKHHHSNTHKQSLFYKVMHIGMGGIYFSIGIIIIVMALKGYEFKFPAYPFNYIFAAIALIYGAFRIYRGVKN